MTILAHHALSLSSHMATPQEASTFTPAPCSFFKTLAEPTSLPGTSWCPLQIHLPCCLTVADVTWQRRGQCHPSFAFWTLSLSFGKQQVLSVDDQGREEKKKVRNQSSRLPPHFLPSSHFCVLSHTHLPKSLSTPESTSPAAKVAPLSAWGSLSTPCYTLLSVS